MSVNNPVKLDRERIHVLHRRLGGGADHAHTVSPRSTIGLQDAGKTNTHDPVADIFVCLHDRGLRNPDTFFPREVHESGSRLRDGEEFWRSQRTLQQRPDIDCVARMQLPATIKLAQVMGGKVICGNNEIGNRGSNRTEQRAQRSQPLISVYSVRSLSFPDEVRGRTKRLDPKPRLGESQSQPRRVYPIGGGRN